MIKLFTALCLCILSLYVKAQAPQKFGKINKEDLELKSCDFEKDANAEVLFDKGEVYLATNFDLIFERHIRIKIFNDKGKDNANIKIKYWSLDHLEAVAELQAQTINLENGNPQFTKVDKKSIYWKRLDNTRSEVAFAFPDVRPGSVIEYKYTLISKSIFNFPDWYFQTTIPTRLSVFNASLPDEIHYKTLRMVTPPLLINTKNTIAKENIPSVREEPLMTSMKDNAQRVYFEFMSIDGLYITFSGSWAQLAKEECGFSNFGGQFKRKIAGEEQLLTKAKELKSNEEKISFLFNEVKNTMKWNEANERYTDEGTVAAWDKKIGNSTEINLILYHLLAKAGIKCFPMMVSTRENGKVNPAYPSRYKFNKTVTYIPIDTATYYIADASNKYADYKIIPSDVLNSFGLYINPASESGDVTFLQKKTPARQVVLVNAEITPEGTMTGTAQLNSFSYNRLKALELYKGHGEKEYLENLCDGDNSIKVASVKMDNLDIDSLPLIQNIKFNKDLVGSDAGYIYVNPNFFTNLHSNPFLSETRSSDISFGYLNTFQLSGIYKVPAGYKVDALPKSTTISLPNSTIIFKRIVGEQDGAVAINYIISRKSQLFFKEDYAMFHEFYKQMHEMLNEQIVLKKS
jgi:hypothetical protein